MAPPQFNTLSGLKLATLLAIALASTAFAETISGKPRIVDGDTLKMARDMDEETPRNYDTVSLERLFRRPFIRLHAANDNNGKWRWPDYLMAGVGLLLLLLPLAALLRLAGFWLW